MFDFVKSEIFVVFLGGGRLAFVGSSSSDLRKRRVGRIGTFGGGRTHKDGTREAHRGSPS